MNVKEESAWYSIAVAVLMLIEEKTDKNDLKYRLDKVIDEMYLEFEK